MSVATPFNFRGNGTGLADCYPRLDVDALTNVITLGGFKPYTDGAVTPALITASRDALMKIYWNLEELKGNLVGSKDTAVTSEDTGVNVADDPEPKGRVCDPAEFEAELFADGISALATLRVYYSFSRFYYNNEFIGYGFSGFVHGVRASMQPAIGVGSLTTYVYLRSYDSSFTSGRDDFAFVDIDGIHFLCEVYLPPFGDVSVAYAANLYGEYERTIGSTLYKSKVDLLANGGLFKFYTYP